LKNRIHASLIAHGLSCPVSDLFGLRGRELLDRLNLPEPWAATTAASLSVIEDLDDEIAACEAELRRLGAAHPYVPLLMSAPGIGWVLAYRIASEIGEIERFATPKKLVGYSGLCPRVYQSGASDRRGPLAKNGPEHLRWALVEAAVHAADHPCHAAHYQQTKKRLGRQRGAKVARASRSPESQRGDSAPLKPAFFRSLLDQRTTHPPRLVARTPAAAQSRLAVSRPALGEAPVASGHWRGTSRVQVQRVRLA